MSARTGGLRAWWSERSKRPLAVAGAALVGAAMLTWAPADAAVDPSVVGRAMAKPAYTQTKTLERVFVGADGTANVQTSNTVTVQVDQTENLRGRQRVDVSWTGAQPSGGRTSSPYGVAGMNQEYPVVILQCRGVDSDKVALEKRIRPETCWTNSFSQRSAVTRSLSDSSWTTDLYADEANKQRLSGVTPFPDTKACPTADLPGYQTHLTRYVAKDGRVFNACDANSMPPEAAVDAAFPAAEVAAFTDGDGNGSIKFEVRSATENEAMGCDEKTACAIVVIPINGLSCQQPQSPQTLADQACRRGGRFLPGSSNFVGTEVDQAVSPSLWWSESNWRNRFTVPITFGLPPDTCDILDPRPPTSFAGSELLAQAALQWAPAYCLDKKRFKFQHNQMSDIAAFDIMENGGSAALVSSAHEPAGEDPIGYAPTVVTGFTVGYVVDRPDNAGEYSRLRLNARLLAKLMTLSYIGSDLGRDHPGMAENPKALMSDPEFVQLNPGLSQSDQEAGAVLLSLSNSSDLIQQVTEYIAQDKAAMEFVNGKPDKWGMKVNPSYKKISLPRPEWPLLDTYVPETTNVCRQKNPGVYLNQLAAPVTTMRKISEALLDGWPNVQTRCDYDPATKLYKLGRGDRQAYGSRFMLGLTSLGDAARYGLRSAELQTSPGTYVGPTEAGLTAAVQLSEQEEENGPFVLDQADVRKSGKAYPGTMVVYTASKLRGLEQENADKIAQFIRVATTEGQKQGNGNGELPAGFLPIKKSGATGKLFRAAQTVADAVEEQKAAPAGKPSETPATSAPSPSGPDIVAPSGDAPSAGEPSAATSTSVPTASVSTAPTATEPTAAISSDTAGRVMPTLLLVGLLGVAMASVLRFVVQAPRRR